MRFQRLDLNLLVALDALLTERSVSLAADRLCLSQSATSSALGRLREYFDDELLVLKGRQMVLTTRAEQLIEPTRAVLEQIRTTIAVAPEFDPETSDRVIRFMASDYMTEVLLVPALARFRHSAPNMRFEIEGMSDSPIDDLDRGFMDLLVTVDFATSADHPSELMFSDDYVVVGHVDNPAMNGPMTSDIYLSLGHVVVRFGRTRIPAFDDWYMRRKKQQRRVEVVAGSFLTVPSLLVGTDRIATMHRRLAEAMAPRYGLKLAPVPFDIPPVRELAQWHLSNNSDAAIRWIVTQLQQLARESGPHRADARPDSDVESLKIDFQNVRGMLRS